MNLFRRGVALLLAAVITWSCLPAGVVSVRAAETEEEEVIAEIAVDQDFPESQELYDGYLEGLFYGGNGIALFGELARNRLSSQGQGIYDCFKGNVQQIAAGALTSTVVKVTNAQILEWGGAGIYEGADKSSALQLFKSEFQLEEVVDALLHDCPYDLYWFDKVTGVKIGGSLTAVDGGYTVNYVKFYFQVVTDWQGSGYTATTPTFNDALVAAAQAALSNAEAVRDQYKASSDYGKLSGYRQEICDLVSYDYSANANNYSTDNDPWQLIYVFDGDSSTNVVCEGYSKAFQYLCEISDFRKEVECYSVTGDLVGVGGHMWNIVSINGCSYLVDVTNSENSSGLFLAGGSGSIAEGYTCGSHSFAYDDDSTTLWGTGDSSILKLSETDYDPCSDGHTEQTLAAEDPTCTETGLTEGAVCSVCGAVTKAQETVPATGHSYESVVTKPTCTEKGYTTYTCGCGDSYVDDYVDATGEHTYEWRVTFPKNTVKGYTDYACSVCGDAYQTAWLDPAAYEGKTLAAIGDSITCGVGVTADQTDYVYLLAQQLGMDYIRLGASGTTLCTDGSRTCNIGKLTESNLAGADVVTILMGINDFCNAKDDYYTLGDITSTDSSTIYGAVRMWCENIRQLRQKDSLADTQFYFLTPVITSWNNSVSSSKDWDQSKTNIHGYTLRDLCNAIVEVCALYDVPVIDLNLTSGLYYVSTEDNSISLFGGDGVHPGTAGHEKMADALEDALLQNELRTDHDHAYGSWITTDYPICKDGTQMHVCTECKATESRALAATHRYESIITQPTCTEKGYTTHTCSNCGDSYVDSYTEATGVHSFVDAVCEHCGAIGGSCGENLTWTLVDGVLTISGNGAMYDYDTVAPWYSYHAEIAKVILPQGLTRIGSYSFYQMEALPQIQIPGSVQSIGSNAFSRSGLTSVEIPEGVTDIELSAFHGCSSLQSVSLPKSLVNLGNSVFASTGLTEVVIPESITDIPNDTFNGCKKLTSVTLPDTLKTIGNAAFYECDVLAEISIPEGVTTIGSSAFAQNESMVSITIPASVQSVGTGAFQWNTHMEQIIFAGNAPTMGTNLFKSITVTAYYPSGDDSWTEEVMQNYGGTVTWETHCDNGHVYESVVTEPHCTEQGYTTHTCTACGDSYVDSYTEATGVHSFVDAVCEHCGAIGGSCGENLTWTLVDGVLTISGTGDMKDYSPDDIRWHTYTADITYVRIADGVTSIGTWAFSECSNMTGVTIPDSVTDIGYMAFSECSSLTGITIPEGVTKIDTGTFSECDSLSSINIPKSVTSIGYSAFNRCTSVKNICFEGDAPEIAETAFAYVTATAYYSADNSTWTEDMFQNYNGSLTWIPDVCKENHTEVIDEAVNATCTTTGLTEGKHCSVCGEVLVAQEVTEKLPHPAGEPVQENEIAASCKVEGSYDEVVYCSECGEELSREAKTIEKQPHTVVEDAAVNATCTATGLTAGSHCSVCGEVIVAQEVTEKLPHTDGETVQKNEIEASCKSEGSYDEVVYCYECGEELSRETKTIEKLPHTVVEDAAVGATCTATGLTAGSHCSVCGEVIVEQDVTEKLPHSGGSPGRENEEPASCKAEGSYDEVICCIECGEELSRETKTIEKLPHTVVEDAAVGAACTTTGLTEGKHCSVCGEVLVKQEIVPETGHSFGDWKVTIDATCTGTGEKRRDCANCYHYETCEIAAKGHTEVIDKAVEATCTESGLTEGKHCSVCGEVLVEQEEIPAAGHSFGDWEVTIDASCTETGEERRNCANCDQFETREVAAKGHVEVIDAAAEATCTETGLTEGKHCSVCNAVLAEQTVIAAKGHLYESEITEPTCVEPGFTTYTCTVCGDSYLDEETEATGEHTYLDDKDETCEICGFVRKIRIETTPMYRLYNPNSGEHFYTGSIEERDNLKTAGWLYEGVAWNAPTNSGTPVYRLFNPNNGDHHYTMSAEERDMLVGVGWRYEGVAWNSATPDNLPLYRLYNSNADCGSHHYTGSEEERENLVEVGWHYEGIGWYGMLH